MAKPSIITPNIRDYIIENCTLTGPEIVELIRKEFSCDISLGTVMKHVRKARELAEESTKTTDAHLSQTISDRVNSYAPTILAQYEHELERMARILENRDDEFMLGDELGKDGIPTQGRSKYWYKEMVKLYGELSKQYLALRPQVSTVRVENALDPDVAALETMTDEQLEALENHKKELKKILSTGENGDV